MSATSATAHAHVEPAGHHELGFIRTYMFSTDHNMIARQFLFLGLSMMIIGGLLALVVRWELAWPETPVPGLGMTLTETGGILRPSQYNMAFTMHATIMIFFVIMPILAGAFRSEERRVGKDCRARCEPILVMRSKICCA